METDWFRIAEAMAGDPPDGSPVWYQKQMAHHMVGPVGPDDIRNVTHAFLIRDPKRMVASYARKREQVTAGDLGNGPLRAVLRPRMRSPWVMRRLLSMRPTCSPIRQALFRLFAAALGIAWTEAMLHWPAGRHPEDGIWAPHWYGRVEASTGFESEEAPNRRRSIPACRKSPMPVKATTRPWPVSA